MSDKPSQRRWHAVDIDTLFSRYIECKVPWCQRVTRNSGAKPLLHNGRKPR